MFSAVPTLNPRQQFAVDHRGGPLMVLAGAGTGKTRVITHRVAKLLEQGTPAWQIMAVTFTNKAAGEMRERIVGICENLPQLAGVEIRELWVGTFHSICAKILRRFASDVGLTRQFAIYDSSDQKVLMGRVLKDMQVDRMYTPQMILGYLDQAKNRGLILEELDQLNLDEPLSTIVAAAWEKYESRLRASDAVDFGDLLLLARRLLCNSQGSAGGQLADYDPIERFKNRFSHVVVDEFQDTNPVQADIVTALSSKAELCVVGDDDQAIYGWRGADVEQFLGFSAQYPNCEVVRLEQNYRSTGHILACADAIISRNANRLGKTLWSELGKGEKAEVICFAHERDEAQWVAHQIADEIEEGKDPREIAVFYRTHAQSRALEEALRVSNVEYRIIGGVRFFDRAEIKDLIAYLRVLLNPAADLDLMRIINRPTRGIGGKTVESLVAYGQSKQCSIWEACVNVNEIPLGQAARKRVSSFVRLIEDIRGEVEGLDLPKIAQRVLERSEYRQFVEHDDPVTVESRLENLQEFVGSLEEFARENPEAGLAEYLEGVSLASEGDRNEVNHAVSLMTVHSAKGLEFESVYLTGLEERIFPHVRLYDDPRGMEEERRLAYVAVTRAQRRLVMSHACQRFLYGQQQINPPSRFLGHLPRSCITSKQLGYGASSFDAPSSEEGPSLAFGWNDELNARGNDPQKSQNGEDWNRDIELDSDDSQSSRSSPSTANGLYVGMLVRHERYGTGDLLQWSGSGAQLKLTIAFPRDGQKTIMARFCQPI